MVRILVRARISIRVSVTVEVKVRFKSEICKLRMCDFETAQRVLQTAQIDKSLARKIKGLQSSVMAGRRSRI